MLWLEGGEERTCVLAHLHIANKNFKNVTKSLYEEEGGLKWVGPLA